MINKPLTAIIVDDEPLALEGLRLRLEKLPEIEVIAEASDGDQAIHLCQTLCPDVLFLDLRLPGLNGIEVVQALQADILPMIVFVSAYGEYALEAFELNAIDYVLKPANLGRLQKTVERIMQRVKPLDSSKEKFKLLRALGETSGIAVTELENWLASDLPLPTLFNQELVIKNNDHEKVFLPIKDIRWIDAAGDYMCVHTPSETHVVRITMKKLVSQLDPKIFTRIHKSTLVNVNCIKSIKPLRNSESILELGDDVQLKVSRNYSSTIQKIVESKQI
ncbi:LytR/AlgR family response regulator transcription factor [Cognaticolwellia beringensis]|uniref:DNA-binding response regulator n=1 Tax=Cognaticolwellia beringensis TaxID=1967665 RepID=A0A222G5E8_9GAMM|nr:LytTR family DNA-binding domain-containing protein [Cognaticolwellia beringensis]ASP47069.1 DNA-binding response regulator [Cognaticolwellia beringensis]|tara:strand:- start:353 stop:1183 length:831 start_codon:yes stop_codon:yes gene_type:complete